MVVVRFVDLRLLCGCVAFVVFAVDVRFMFVWFLYLLLLVDCVPAVSVFNLLCFYSGCVVCILVVFSLEYVFAAGCVGCFDGCALVWSVRWACGDAPCLVAWLLCGRIVLLILMLVLVTAYC